MFPTHAGQAMARGTASGRSRSSRFAQCHRTRTALRTSAWMALTRPRPRPRPACVGNENALSGMTILAWPCRESNRDDVRVRWPCSAPMVYENPKLPGTMPSSAPYGFQRSCFVGYFRRQESSNLSLGVEVQLKWQPPMRELISFRQERMPHRPRRETQAK